MKRSKRQESSIIIYFGFYFVLLLCLLIFSGYSLYPRVKAIEEKKEVVQNTYNTFNKTTQQGITFGEFKQLSTKGSLNKYQKELINSISIDFYNDSFKNLKGNNYLSELNRLNSSVDNIEELKKLEEKEKTIVKLLPTYSESNIQGEENLLTDFKFINYLENILSTFSIDYNNEIGISNIQLLEEFSESGKKSKLDTDIYYIPLSLSIEGTKYNIVNFIYFLENVGNITLHNNELNIYNQNQDKFLYRGVKIMLKNDQRKSLTKNQYNNYNIFEHQLIEIESINFIDNINNGEITSSSQTKKLAQKIKDTQGDEKIKVNIDLRFYIKGIQNIKLINHIEEYIKYFDTTKKLVAKKMGDKNLTSIEKSFISAIQSEIKEMTKTLKPIKISIAKQENLNETLKDTIEYTNILHSMHAKIGYDMYISQFLKELKILQNNQKLLQNNQVLKEYLNNIKKEMELLSKQDIETQEEYNNRLNSKKLFKEIFIIQKNIELKK